MPEKRRLAIASLAGRYGLSIVEDAINRPLLPDPPPLIARLAPENTFLLASTSKTVAAGLRVGFVSGPAGGVSGLVRVAQSINLMVSPLPVEILVHWLEDGTVERTILAKREELLIRQELAAEYLGSDRIQNHPASYFTWLKLPQETNGPAFTLAAFRRGVIVTPAQAFAADESKAPEAIRLCPATPYERSEVRQGLNIIAGLLKEGGTEVFETI
jgi:DNA-binding transcriptional MocR family regulator